MLKTINYLKLLGFSLSEIKSIIIRNSDIENLKKHLYAKKQQALIDINCTEIRYKRIVALLNVFDKQKNTMNLI